MGKLGVVGFIIFLIFGLYFLNVFFNFVPQLIFSADISKYLSLLGGILLIIGGIYFSKVNKYR